ncbi:MAG: magnesium transporter [Ketobacteraceae bacterium]|nr:magnesium transporter [Ketobacteraceae bacterium]
MAKNPNSQLAQQTLQAFNEALDSGTFVEVRHMLRAMAPAEVAHLIESSPPRSRNIIWKLIDQEEEGEILQYLNEEIAADFLRHRDTQDIINAFEDFEVDDIADLLQELPRKVTERILEAMDDQNRQRIEAVLSYGEDTAGGLMNPESVTVRPDISLDVVLRYLRLHQSLPEMTDSILVVNRADKFIGVIPLTKLLISDPSMSVRDAMLTDVTAIPANTPASDVATIFERQDLVSAPVVDDEGRLIGRITIDDVVDVIREGADHSLMSMAGLDEYEDTFAPVWKTTRRRSVWLGINLLTALLASWVIGLFEATLEKVVALAVLMPIVASMGGIAGSQTLTVVIRGMALGHVGPSNASWLLSREMGVGVLNGLFWSVVIGAVASLWFSDYRLGVIIASAMVINLMVAAVAGASLPLILKRMNIDPALSGGVVLTTVTDVVGFFAFLGLATAFYA